MFHSSEMLHFDVFGVLLSERSAVSVCSKIFIILATKSVNQQVLMFVLFDGGAVFLMIFNFQDKGRLIKVFHSASYSQCQAHVMIIFQGR